MRRPSCSFAAAALGSVLVLASCGSTDTTAEMADGLTVGAVDLSGSCPSSVVIQTHWHPQIERGPLYELLGDRYEVDADQKAIRGPLMAGGDYTGVDVEIRAGGPAIGFQDVVATMYQDDTITMGYTTTDQAIQQSAAMPTISVMAQFEKNPQMIMWDPQTYPEVESIGALSSALAGTGGVIRYAGGTAYMEYLRSMGLVSDGVLDDSYDGTPANFVAAAGRDAQQGYSTSEAYVYEHEVPSWDKPVSYQLIHDAGWDAYAQQLSVREADLDELAPCLEELIPVMQRAEVDFFDNPTHAIDLTMEQVAEFRGGQAYSRETADWAVTAMREQGIVSNGPNATVGDFDANRVADFFDKALPVFSALGQDIAPGLRPDDLYTNQFIDPEIGFRS